MAARDLNIAWGMDALYDSKHGMYGSGLLFTRARDAGWWRCHLKFHAGEEQTFFRPGQPGQMYQLDHIFSDR